MLTDIASLGTEVLKNLQGQSGTIVEFKSSLEDRTFSLTLLCQGLRHQIECCEVSYLEFHLLEENLKNAPKANFYIYENCSGWVFEFRNPDLRLTPGEHAWELPKLYVQAERIMIGGFNA